MTVNIVYMGKKFTALSVTSKSIPTTSLPMAEIQDGKSSIVFAASDCSTDPVFGQYLSVDGEDRLIKAASLDPAGITWTVEHSEAYSEWCDISGSMHIEDELEEILESVKVRVADPESLGYSQSDSGDFEEDVFKVYMRVSAWPYDERPQVGFQLSFDAREDMYIESIEKSNGDYVLTCKGRGGG